MTQIMKNKSLVYGVGINDADYVLSKEERVNGKRKVVWICQFYSTWKDMLKRCYSKNALARNPTYRCVTVCPEWLAFSNFKAWMEKQDWQGKQLDKDLLVKGNKVYSPDTCVFVDHRINSFTIDCAKSRGKYLIGTSWQKSRNKFRVLCSNPFTGKREYLGLFTDELDAHLAWKARKHELAYQLADTCNDARLAQALKTRYS